MKLFLEDLLLLEIPKVLLEKVILELNVFIDFKVVFMQVSGFQVLEVEFILEILVCLRSFQEWGHFRAVSTSLLEVLDDVEEALSFLLELLELGLHDLRFYTKVVFINHLSKTSSIKSQYWLFKIKTFLYTSVVKLV